MTKAEIQQVKLRFGIIGNTEALTRAIDVAIQVAPTDLSVLITGESGVGKESFPQIIHQYSRRNYLGMKKGLLQVLLVSGKDILARPTAGLSFWMKSGSCLCLLRRVCFVCLKAESL